MTRARSAACALAAACWLLAWSGAAPGAEGSVLQVNPEPAAAPWWQRARWQPKSTVVHGVNVKRLHPAWCAAEAFSRAAIGDALLAQVPMRGLEFAVEGAFDGSTAPQLAFVGAYRRCAGEEGLYLAIVEPRRDRPRLRFLIEVPNAGSAFAAIAREPDGTLAVWWCPDCDHGARIEFNRENRGYFVAGPAVPRTQ